MERMEEFLAVKCLDVTRELKIEVYCKSRFFFSTIIPELLFVSNRQMTLFLFEDVTFDFNTYNTIYMYDLRVEHQTYRMDLSFRYNFLTISFSYIYIQILNSSQLNLLINFFVI